MRIPSYLVDFKCIGGSCEDNCCIGWDVDIDKKTFQKYQKVTHPLMKRELNRYVKVNPEVYSDSINYAFAILDERKHCSFLNADHLCMIQKYLGESYLSNVCGNFPRITNIVDGLVERSATPSCPEIVRLMVENRDAMALVSVENPSPIPLVTYELNQQDKRFKNKLLSQLILIRNQCMSFFEDTAYTFEEQLCHMSHYVLALVKLERDALAGKKTIDFNTVALQNSAINCEISKSNKQNFYDLSDLLMEHLRTVGAHDSERFTEFSNDASQGDVEIGAPVFESFMRSNPHIFKNLFLNHIYKNLFPFSEGENPEDALWLFLCRYALLKRQLIGLSGYHGALTLEIVASYIQAFSKVIEHHKHFESETIQALKRHKFNTKKLMEAIF